VLTSVDIVPQEEIINIPENMKSNALNKEKEHDFEIYGGT
jgi:hypothetical protein